MNDIDKSEMAGVSKGWHKYFFPKKKVKKMEFYSGIFFSPWNSV